MSNDIQTTEDYWDCECVGLPYEYIHAKSQTMCTVCGQHQDDMPDSRVAEVDKALELLSMREIMSNDGFPICHNDCANWPQTTSNTIFGCACECHK